MLAKQQDITGVIKAKKKVSVKKVQRIQEIGLPKYEIIGSQSFRRAKITNLYIKNVPEFSINMSCDGLSANRSETL